MRSEIIETDLMLADSRIYLCAFLCRGTLTEDEVYDLDTSNFEQRCMPVSSGMHGFSVLPNPIALGDVSADASKQYFGISLGEDVLPPCDRKDVTIHEYRMHMVS